MLRPLLILGASVRAAAQSASIAGYEVIASDLFLDVDLQEAAATCVSVDDYPHAFAKVRRQFPDIPVIYTGALENYPSLLEQLGPTNLLWGNDAVVVRSVRDPWRLQTALTEQAIPFPKLHSTEHPSNELSSITWLQKPSQSAGGNEIQPWNGQADLTNGTYLQAFVDGTPCSAAFVANGSDATFLGTSEMLVGCAWAGGKDFQYNGSISTLPRANELRQWQAIGTTLTRHFRLRGLFGVDAIRQNEQIVPAEVNPRYSASMEILEHQHLSSMIQLHVNAFHLGELPRIPPKLPARTNGKLVLYAKRDSTLPPDLTAAPGTRFADVPQPDTVGGTQIAAGQPMISILTDGANLDDVREKLQEAANEVYRRLDSV